MGECGVGGGGGGGGGLAAVGRVRLPGGPPPRARGAGPLGRFVLRGLILFM